MDSDGVAVLLSGGRHDGIATRRGFDRNAAGVHLEAGCLPAREVVLAVGASAVGCTEQGEHGAAWRNQQDAAVAPLGRGGDGAERWIEHGLYRSFPSGLPEYLIPLFDDGVAGAGDMAAPGGTTHPMPAEAGLAGV